MPLNQNINYVQLVAAAAMLLAMFGFNLDAKTQAAIVSLILSGSAVVTWVLHTFVNHPANVDKLTAKLSASGVDRATIKNITAALLLCLLLGPALVTLSACAAPTDPQSVLDDLEFAATGAETAYTALCSGNPQPGWCMPQDQIAAIEKKISDTEKLAQDAINAGKGSADINALLNDLTDLLNDFNVNYLHKTQAKKKLMAPTFLQKYIPFG